MHTKARPMLTSPTFPAFRESQLVHVTFATIGTWLGFSPMLFYLGPIRWGERQQKLSLHSGGTAMPELAFWHRAEDISPDVTCRASNCVNGGFSYVLRVQSDEESAAHTESKYRPSLGCGLSRGSANLNCPQNSPRNTNNSTF